MFSHKHWYLEQLKLWESLTSDLQMIIVRVIPLGLFTLRTIFNTQEVSRTLVNDNRQCNCLRVVVVISLDMVLCLFVCLFVNLVVCLKKHLFPEREFKNHTMNGVFGRPNPEMSFLELIEDLGVFYCCKSKPFKYQNSFQVFFSHKPGNPTQK